MNAVSRSALHTQQNEVVESQTSTVDSPLPIVSSGMDIIFECCQVGADTLK